MSWDLYVVPRKHLPDPNDWLEEIAETPGDAVAARQHADLVRARRPELEASEPDEEGAVELWTSEESGLPLQVLLDGRHASVTVAYWDLRDRTEELTELLVDVVTAVTEGTGWLGGVRPAGGPRGDSGRASTSLPHRP